jgi:ankyrin repeat protein
MDIFEATEKGNLIRVNELITAGVDVNKENNGGWRPISIAVDKGYVDIVNALITVGADVNTVTNTGLTPLILATVKGYIDIVNILITARADVNKTIRLGLTPLYLATRNNNINIVRILITAGADVNKATNDGSTPLILAADKGYVNIVNILITARADVNKANSHGETPLYLAVRYNYINIVQILITAGADVNKASNNGSTPLILAAKHNNINIVRILITAGADVNKSANDGWTILYVAVLYDNIDIVKVLINAGADVNKETNDGRTPLHISVGGASMDIIKLLLNAGADVNKETNNGKNALDMVHHLPYVNLLLEYGARRSSFALSRELAPAQAPASSLFSLNLSLAPPPEPPTPQTRELLIAERKQKIILETNLAIRADTSILDNINVSDTGCDVIERGCSDENNVKIQDFINENPDTSIIIKVIDSPTHSRHFLYTRDNLLEALKNSIVYPCLEANNLPGRESNVVTDLPLYSLATIINVKVLVKKDMLDTLLNNTGNLFIVIYKHIYSYPSIASHNIIFNSGDFVGALHCNAGSEAEKLYNIKRVNVPMIGGYYHKFQKYINKLK